MRRLSININLVRQFLFENNINSLAFYFQAKIRYKSSTLFCSPNKKLTSRTLGEKFGISHNAAGKYVKVLKANDLLVEHHGNLVFKSLKHQPEYKHQRKKNCVTIDFEKSDSISDIVAKLKAVPVIMNLIHQKFIINLKSDLEKSKRIDMKLYKKHLSHLSEKMKRKINYDLNLSNAKIAGMLNCSEQTVSSLKRRWSELGIMQFKRKFKIIGRVSKGTCQNLNGEFLGGRIFVSKYGFIREFLYSEVIPGKMLDRLFAKVAFK